MSSKHAPFDPHAWLARRKAGAKAQTKTAAEKLKPLLAVLAQQGCAQITITYDGEGDSGSVQHVQFIGEDGKDFVPGITAAVVKRLTSSPDEHEELNDYAGKTTMAPLAKSTSSPTASSAWNTTTASWTPFSLKPKNKSERHAPIPSRPIQRQKIRRLARGLLAHSPIGSTNPKGTTPTFAIAPCATMPKASSSAKKSSACSSSTASVKQSPSASSPNNTSKKTWASSPAPPTGSKTSSPKPG